MSDDDTERPEETAETADESAGETEEPTGNESETPDARADASDESRETPGENEVYCRECGEIIRENAEICPECGVRQKSPSSDFDNSAGVAAVASLLIPGAGQIYLGHIGRGLAFIFGSFVAGLLSIFLVGIPLLLGIWLYAIYDAYHLAEDPERAG